MRLGALLMAAALVAAPSAATAQAPFGPLPATPASTTPAIAPPRTTTSTQAGESGLSTTAQILIFLGAAGLIAAIGYVIMRDAKAHAPDRARGGDRRRATTTPRADRVQRSRARAKSARRQRKRNR